MPLPGREKCERRTCAPAPAASGGRPGSCSRAATTLWSTYWTARSTLHARHAELLELHAAPSSRSRPAAASGRSSARSAAGLELAVDEVLLQDLAGQVLAPWRHLYPGRSCPAPSLVSRWSCWSCAWATSWCCSTRRSSTSRCRTSAAGLHVGVSGLQWVVDGYALALAGVMLAGGTIGDLRGHKRVVLAGWPVRRRLAGLRPGGSVGMLIACRVVQGVGAALTAAGHARRHRRRA